jgi:integrase
MSTRRRKQWSLMVGAYGHKVTVRERRIGGPLYLRWWDSALPNGGNWRWRSLHHTDQKRGEEQARELAAQILAAGQAVVSGRLTVADLFGRYERDVTAHKKGAQPAEDRRRMALWQIELGSTFDVGALDFRRVDQFVRKRRAGGIVVPGRTEQGRAIPQTTLRPASDTTAGADIIFLQSVLNWATNYIQSDGSRLIDQNPLRGYKRPKNRNPQRPRATYDRFLAVRAKADEADPQQLFGSFLDLVEALGWRVSSICALRASDIDPSTSKTAPFGRIHKRGEVDKEGVDMWVPLSQPGRAAIDHIRAVNPCLGDAPLFPAPRPATEEPTPWRRWHARDLLERAEKLAEVEPLKGGDFHPYRRKWASERKHLSIADVAAAGGWRDLRSLENCYQSADDESILAVVTETRKLRTVK